MPASFAGQATLVVNGLPLVYLKDVEYTIKTGKEVVVGSSLDDFPVGKINGVKQIDLSINCYVPTIIPEPDWTEVSDAVVTIFSKGSGTNFITFTGVEFTEVGRRWEEQGKAMRSLKGFALRYVGTP